MTEKLVTRIKTAAGVTELHAKAGVIANSKASATTTTHYTGSHYKSDGTYVGASSSSHTQHFETFLIHYDDGSQQSITLDGKGIKLHTGQRVTVGHISDKDGRCFLYITNNDEKIYYLEDIKPLKYGKAAIRRPLGFSAIIMSLILGAMTFIAMGGITDPAEWFRIPYTYQVLPVKPFIYSAHVAGFFFIFWHWQKGRMRKQLTKILGQEWNKFCFSSGNFEPKDQPLYPNGPGFLLTTGKFVLSMVLIVTGVVAMPAAYGYVEGKLYAGSIKDDIKSEFDENIAFLKANNLLYSEDKYFSDIYRLDELFFGDANLTYDLIEAKYYGPFIEIRESTLDKYREGPDWRVVPSVISQIRFWGYEYALKNTTSELKSYEYYSLRYFINFKDDPTLRAKRTSFLKKHVRDAKVSSIDKLPEVDTFIAIAATHTTTMQGKNPHEKACYELWNERNFSMRYTSRYRDELGKKCQKYRFIHL